MHPGAWVAWIACASLVAVSTTNPFYLLPLFAVAFAVHSACRLPGPTERAFRIFVGFGVATIATRTLLVLFGPITEGSVVAAALEGLRLAVLLALFGTFNSVIDPFRIVRLTPRRFHEPALAAALAASIAPRMIQALGEVREAQRLRGIDLRGLRGVPALAVPVLETGMEGAVTLAESMDARGHGRGPRTRYRPERWSGRATAVVVTSVASLATFLVFAGANAGELSPSTFPLRWPSASLWLLAAVVLLAAPVLWVSGRERAP